MTICESDERAGLQNEESKKSLIKKSSSSEINTLK